MPAININLSVSRIGGRSQNPTMQQLSATVMQELSNFRSAEEYTRFSDQMSEFAEQELEIGRQLTQALSQEPNDFFSLPQQRVIIEVVLGRKGKGQLNIEKLKHLVQTKLPIHKPQSDEAVSRLIAKTLKDEV